jgi:hypothetical protein
MKRLAGIIAALTFGALVLAGTAGATKPFMEHSDGTVTITSHGSVLSSLFGTITHGRTVIQLDANGDVISSTTNGTEEDLCAELAGP